MKLPDRIAAAEALLEQCEKDLETLEKRQEDLQRIEQNRLALDAYYTNDYMADYDAYTDKDRAPRVVDQDSVWNVMTGLYQEKIALLKALANSI